MQRAPVPHNHVAIIGTGIGGVGAAIRLQQDGVNDLVLLDRASDVGGVWRDNVYPGAAVDVPSSLYAFSFAPNPNWSNTYARQGEIHTYVRKLVDDFGLGDRIVFECDVLRLDWDTAEQRWHIETTRGARTATHVVLATGALSEPRIPDIPGLKQFGGARFHSARWDHAYDVTGKKVAVIGTGASAVQFIPAIAPAVEHMAVFQRTPSWVIPRHDREIDPVKQQVYRTLPAVQRLERLRLFLGHEFRIVGFQNPSVMKLPERKARQFLEQEVRDPELRAKLVPNHRFGCKRVLVSNDYLATLVRPNVSVVTDGIREVVGNGVVDETGTLHPADAIIFGTGFETNRLPLTDRTHGPDGRTMADIWAGNPTAYAGTAVAGFPNCYLIHGPNAGSGHQSVTYFMESQFNYITAAVGYARRNGLAAVEPTRAAQDEFSARVDKLNEGTVWTEGGCNSWYINAEGRNINIWPGTGPEFRRRSLNFDPTHHLVHRRAAAPKPVVS